MTLPGTTVAAHIYVGRSAETDRLKITDEGLKYGAFRMVSGRDWLVLLGHDQDFKFPQYTPRSYADIQRATQEWDARTSEHWGNPFWVARIYRQYNAKVGVWDYDERGSLNAVYEFLRGLGVRWYMPGDLGEIVPEQKTISLASVDKTVRPDFPYRNLGDYSPTFDAGTREAILYRLRVGLEPILGIAHPHGLNEVNGRDEVKQAHPEFYSGKRVPQPGDLYFASCLSSEELFAYTVKYACAVFEIYPDKQSLSIMPNDGFWRGNMCQCDHCQGKDTPQRGGAGVLSDYVWGFVDRVARELYKTHPDRKVINCAYGAYTLPPQQIAKFSPNVMVGIVGVRAEYTSAAARAQALETRQGYLEKLTPGNLFTYNHYLHSPSRLPAYFPHAIAADLRSLKGLSQGEFIELAQGPGATGMHVPGFNHLNVYVTARYYWNADQDIDVLLHEYYEKFYGPAAQEMQAFIEFCEANWQRMSKEAAPTARALELLAAARQAAGDTVYGQRIDLVVDYCQASLTQLRDRLARGRDKDLPKIEGAFQGNPADIKLDGQLDDKFWKGALWCSHGSLREVETGREPFMGTSFTVGWADQALYFGIRCAERDTQGLRITATKADDLALYEGDLVELLLETQLHSYYRIAIAPNGTIVDADMRTGAPETRWSSQAEVATHVGDGFWSAEVRIPMDWDVAKAVDPLNGVVGYKPTPLYPLSFNLCRQRVRARGTERSAFSPTGQPSFCEPRKFGELIVR